MSVLDTLITDRTQADVARVQEYTRRYLSLTAAERAEWDAGMRGAYNASDLNRVTEAMEYLVGVFAEYGYAANYVPIEIEPGRTVWEDSDIPTPETMRRYLDNVAALRAVFEVLPTTPNVPADMAGLTWAEANDIERIFLDIELIIERIIKGLARLKSFDFWSGNRPIPAAESDRGRTWAELDSMNTTWANWQVADWYLLLYGNLKAEGVVE